MPKLLSKAQKAAIAKGKLAGKKPAEIAREAGVSESKVTHAAKDPEIQGILRRAIAANRKRLESLYGRTLDSLEADLAKADAPDRRSLREEAIRTIALADRLEGVRESTEAVSAASASPGGGTPELDAPAEGFQLVELLQRYHKIPMAQAEAPKDNG